MTSLLIQHLITTTLLALLVSVVCRLAKPAPAARHILWSLVILKLMIPPMGELAINIPALNATTAPTVSNPIALASQEPRTPIHQATTSNRKEPILTAAITTETANTTSTKSTPTALPPSDPISTKSIATINWTALAIATWLIGAIAMAALQLIRWQRFTAQTTASAETPEWLRDETAAVAKRLDCKDVPVIVCNRLSTPAVAGVLKPQILVPSALLERLPCERWRALLTHELAHVKRHDTWWRALELACGIVWFWNPVFWFARKQARITAEHACDAWVVWAMPDQRRAYADSLVDVSEWASTPNLPATAIGMSAANREKLEARLTSIVSGKISRHASRAMRIIAAMLLAASLPGWAIEQKTKQQTQSKQTKSTSSTKSTQSTESPPLQLAQAETETQAAATKPKTGQPTSDRVTQALKKRISIEFENEHVQTILEFLSQYIGVNIVLDYSVVEAEHSESSAEMEVVHVGPHWYKHPRREYLGTSEWPKSQVVDGMVRAFDGEVATVMDVLDKLLPEAGMTYAITPNCIWITVAKSQFEITAPNLQPESWVWHPFNRAFLGTTNEKVGGNFMWLNNFGLQSDHKISFKTDEAHISEITPKIYDLFARRPMPDGSRVVFRIPPIIVDAAAIAPPREGAIPKSYLIASDKDRSRSLFTGGGANDLMPSDDATRKFSPAELLLLRGGVMPSEPVTSGIVPFIKLDDVPLENTLTALLRPLNLTHVPGPNFIYITSPERSATVDFSDSPVPADQTKLGRVLEETVTIKFEDEHIATILDFLSGYLGINIVVDSRAVIPENPENYSATGTNPVTDGHVPFIHVSDLRFADTLKALLTPLNLDYSVGPGYIWVSSPEFIAEDSQTAPNTPASAPKRRPQPQVKARPEPKVRTEAATVTSGKKPGPVIDGKEFRRITRWENGDPRIEIEFNDGHLKWLQIGDAFEDMEIADIDVIANQVIIEHRGELRVLQLSWPVQEGVNPSPRRKHAGRTTSRWTWTDIPYGNVKFGPIARWENSDPRLKVEFPNGQHKWLEVGDAIGNARIGNINIIANQVIVRTPEGQTRTFDLPRPIQVPSATAPRAKRSSNQPKQRTWTPVDYGDVTIGRIARWEESRDEQVEIELANGERKWLEAGQSVAGITVVSIDILNNRVTVTRNGTTEVVQLP